MTPHIRIVNRTSGSALLHYMRRHRLSLPEIYWQDVLQILAQGIMEIEVSQLIEASRYERRSSRRAYRNGYRDSLWQTRQGDILIRIPKLRSGTYYPAALENYENELLSFAFKIYLHGVKHDDVAALLDDLTIDAHPYQIAELHETLYDWLDDYRHRDLSAETINLDLIPVEQHGHQRYLALAISDNEILAHDITPEADDAFWQDFIRRVNQRSAHGVQYVAVSQLYHFIQLERTPQSSQLLLVA